MSSLPDLLPAPLAGVIPILVTPFHPDGRVDLDAMDRQVEFLVGAGVGWAGFGFGSEVPRLSDAELDILVRRTVEVAAGRLHVFGNIDLRSRAGGIEQARRVAATGAAAALVRPGLPGGVEPATLVDTFAAVAAAGLPIIVQDAPQNTGVELSPVTLARLLTDVPGVAAVKIEPAGAAAKMEQIVEALRGEEGVIIGGAGGSGYLHELARGARGTMPGPAHPELFAAVTRLHHEGRRPEAHRLMSRVLPLLELGRRDMDSFLVTQKHVLVRRGVLANAELARPHRPVDRQLTAEVDELLDALELLTLWDHCRELAAGA